MKSNQLNSENEADGSVHHRLLFSQTDKEIKQVSKYT